jgi:hypothetical protein
MENLREVTEIRFNTVQKSLKEKLIKGFELFLRTGTIWGRGGSVEASTAASVDLVPWRVLAPKSANHTIMTT